MSIDAEIPVDTAQSLTQYLTDLYDAEYGRTIWSDKARDHVTALAAALIELRNKGRLELRLSVVAEYLKAEKYLELLKCPHVSTEARGALSESLRRIPGYIPTTAVAGDPVQHASFYELFGYYQMQFTRVMLALDSESAEARRKEEPCPEARAP